MKTKDKILLFIPGYNCEKQIVRVLGQLDEGIMSFLTGVIVVNNRSTDETEEAVAAFMREHPKMPVTLLRNQDNYGLGGSHKVAFRYAIDHGYDYVIVLHGDDQGDIHDMDRVLKKRLYASLGFLIVLMYLSMGHMMWSWPVPAVLEKNHVAMGLIQLLLTVIIMVVNQKFFISGF